MGWGTRLGKFECTCFHMLVTISPLTLTKISGLVVGLCNAAILGDHVSTIPNLNFYCHYSFSYN